VFCRYSLATTAAQIFYQFVWKMSREMLAAVRLK
jgi:hypothetical protein